MICWIEISVGWIELVQNAPGKIGLSSSGSRSISEVTTAADCKLVCPNQEIFKFFKRSFKFQNYTILTAFPSFATLLGSKGWRPPILWGTHSQRMKRLRAADFLWLNFWFEEQESCILMSVEDFRFKGNVRPLEAAQKVWTTANPWFEAGKVFYTTTHQILQQPAILVGNSGFLGTQRDFWA